MTGPSLSPLPEDTMIDVPVDEPIDVPDGTALSGLMKKAAVWSGINSFVLRLGQFSVGVVTARIIEPKQFGIFAVGTSAHCHLEFRIRPGVSDAELATALADLDEPHTTVGGVNLVVGLRPSSWARRPDRCRAHWARRSTRPPTRSTARASRSTTRCVSCRKSLGD